MFIDGDTVREHIYKEGLQNSSKTVLRLEENEEFKPPINLSKNQTSGQHKLYTQQRGAF